ncbi:MAG: alpha/beta hydrolase [Pseudomonadota bacterium]
MLLTISLAGVLGVLLAVYSALARRRIDARWPAIGASIDVDGQRLHYTDQGQGPTIVLIHGASSNLREFQHSLVPLLATDHRVLAFDRPGCGHSPRATGGAWLNPQQLAHLILEACERLGVERPIFVGHSLAGAVVMAALLHEASRVRGGVVLAGAMGHWVSAPGIGERLRQVPGLLPMFAHTLLQPIGTRVIPSALRAVFAPHAVPEGHAERIGAALALRPASFAQDAHDIHHLSAYLQLASARYRDIKQPLRVIHGTADTIVPYWNHGQRFEGVLPGMQVELMDGHGHALHHVACEEVASSIRSFARSLEEHQ